ncbi:transposase [Candidatus Magnetaquiglobus chichijimensis]|uniref:transposase n=1 Tax=Candidatus Magnetaquiglobus chichijimensis TaxID=3141448 RepID=UPI003B979534
MLIKFIAIREIRYGVPGFRFGGKPLGRPKKEIEANREELREAKRQRRWDHLERIPIEGKFGQGKNRHGLAKIRAKLADTSASWIRAIFLVMNLNLLVSFFCPESARSEHGICQPAGLAGHLARSDDRNGRPACDSRRGGHRLRQGLSEEALS